MTKRMREVSDRGFTVSGHAGAPFLPEERSKLSATKWGDGDDWLDVRPRRRKAL